MAKAIENYQAGAWTALAYSARAGVPASNLAQVINAMELSIEFCDPSDLAVLQEFAPGLPHIPETTSEIQQIASKVQTLRFNGLHVETLSVFNDVGGGVLQRSLEGMPGDPVGSRPIEHVIWNSRDPYGIFLTAGKGELEAMVDKAMEMMDIEPDTSFSPR